MLYVAKVSHRHFLYPQKQYIYNDCIQQSIENANFVTSTML